MRANRLNEILEIIHADGSWKISALAEKFEVSTETIRKDILYLEDRGLLTKAHGVAMPASGLLVQHISQRVTENLEEKSRIARKALSLVPKNGLIFLDSGSTVLCLARLLRAQSALTIVTCALNIANELMSSQNAVCLTGGDLKDATNGLTGLWTANAIKSIRPDVTFLGTSGVMTFDGPTSQSFEDAETKKLLLDNSRLSVMLMDSSKLNDVAPICFAKWSDVDILITDKELSADEKDNLNVRREIVVA